MNLDYYYKTLQDISLSMFRKSFFGIFHGSISAKVEDNQFMINKEDTIFDSVKKDDLVLLYTKKDYRWNEASMDADIHLNIYKNIKEAK
ncbi:MAG: class II aldolase/adducin family protein, partial [Campylobacter sp.]|nr:class II aldolase/adducin family protein [Campylobacter sp.]